jgi:hypothetical protein
MRQCIFFRIEFAIIGYQNEEKDCIRGVYIVIYLKNLL